MSYELGLIIKVQRLHKLLVRTLAKTQLKQTEEYNGCLKEILIDRNSTASPIKQKF